MAASRRGFLLGVAATACIGCTNDVDGSDEGTVTVPPREDSYAGGFGGRVRVGSLEEVRAGIDDGSGFLYVPAARAWVVRYPEAGLEAARGVYDDETLAGLEQGLMALYQQCPHLGCRVPECTSSQRFECPCHASAFSHVGEYVSGPAPRGMDRFALRVVDDTVVLDTERVLQGLAIGTHTVDEESAGPACIAPAN